MPADITPELQTHLEQEGTTLAVCWKITRRDGTKLGFTNHTRDLSGFGDGVTYKADTGIVPASSRSSSDTGADTQEILGIIRDGSFDDLEVLAGKFDYAEIEVFACNWADVSMGKRILHAGRLGQVQLATKTFEANVKSWSGHGGVKALNVVQATCKVKRLGDTRCGVVLPENPGAVDSVTDRRTFVDASLAGETATGGVDYYAYGLLTWLTGLNAGLEVPIRSYNTATGSFVLVHAMRSDIQVGDTFQVSPGCNRTFETCRDKFANSFRFDGFPFVPGNDLVLKVPR